MSSPTAWNLSVGVIELQKFDPGTGRLLSARIPGGVVEGDDFAVVEGDALIVVSPASTPLGLVAPSACADNSTPSRTLSDPRSIASTARADSVCTSLMTCEISCVES